MKLSAILLIVVVFGLLLFGCSNTVEKGLLQGEVNICPISPVEHPGKTMIIRCDVYDVRKIMIYDKDGTKLIQQVDIDCNAEENYARYRVELEPGTYRIDINHIGVDFSKDVPKQIEIQAGINTRLDIDIDTGIR